MSKEPKVDQVVVLSPLQIEQANQAVLHHQQAAR